MACTPRRQADVPFSVPREFACHEENEEQDEGACARAMTAVIALNLPKGGVLAVMPRPSTRS
ncbi:hypothetical protein ACFOD8_15650, partial [Arthrobacter agilis]|uniref:hypothetical protein n=1 Tax=Arthrobacter agilis TaxID=37921 RepID=UPI003622C811